MKKTKNRISLTAFLMLLTTQLMAQNDPSVIINDQNNNTGNITIDCNYNFVPPKRIKLTASYPDLKTTTDYTVENIVYNPTGLYTDGTPVPFAGDDVWSSNLPIGFTFCFYGNNYTSVNVGDNGIVRFGYNSSIPEGSFSSITNTTPNPSLVRNAIFGGFQDHILAPVGFGCSNSEFCGSVSYLTTGMAPFRKFIVNFNELNHFNCSGFNDRNSTFQIILYETTNAIEVNVKEKPLTCNGNISANGNGNSLIGLNNSNGTLGIAPPGRNTGVWSVTDESYRFNPSGASATQISWYNAAGNFLGNANPIEVVPPQNNTFYTAIVNYNTCTPRQIQSTININYDLDYPVAPDITANFCDTAPPFPNEIVDIESLLAAEPGIIKTIHASQIEADNNLNPLSGMQAFNMTAASQVFYYRESKGSCYATGTITVQLFNTPQVTDQELYICDTGNDGTETVLLNGLTNQITGYQPWMSFAYFQNLANATANVNPFTSVNITQPPGFYDVYVRVFNPGNTSCYSIFRLTLRMRPRLVLAPVADFCINDPNFNLQEIFDLTSIPITATTGPTNPTDLTVHYYTTLANAQNGTNPIGNSSNYPVSIPAPLTSITLYAGATATGFCPNYIPIVISFCEADGNDDGDGDSSGNGGFGGAGACLESGDAIPTFDLVPIYNNVMTASGISPIPTPLGFYSTLLAAQTQDITFELTLAEIAAYVPVAPFSAVWVRYLDDNGIPGIRRIIVPLKFKAHEVRNFDICDVYNNGTENINLLPIPYLAQIQSENPGETVTAYATMADYLTNSNPINNINVVAPNTTVYVKVSSYGCDSDYTLNFNLVPFNVRTPALEQVCDIGADGAENFDISAILSNYTTGFTNPIVTIHSSSNGAYNESNTIPNNTTNYPITASSAIWIRIEEDPAILPLTCPTIQEINFGFYNSVSVNPIGTIEICDLDNNGQETITNLNAIVASIVNEIPAEPIIKKLYTSLAAAQTNDPVFEILPDWDTFVYDTTLLGVDGTIYLYLENSITGCERIVPINISIKSLPLTTNNNLTLCDFENNNQEVVSNMAIFNPQITANHLFYSFQYFANMAEATAGTPQIPADYTITNGETIYVKIQSGTNTGCSAIIPVQINFNASPIVNNSTPLICDNLGNNTEIVNLNAYQNTMVANLAGLTFKYYASQTDAMQDLNAFSNFVTFNYTVPSFNGSNQSPPVYVRVSNTFGCFSVATLIFERKPVIEAYDAIQFSCDISTTNQLQGIFNLNNSIPRTSGQGMISVPANYTISFHTTNAEANAGTNAIVNTTNYIVTADQTSYVYVRFLDNITQCFTVKTLELQIYNLPKFVNSVYDVCDDNLDGIYSINLINLNGTVVEDPTPFVFGYYNSEADAMAGINPITNIANYTIALNEFPKIIYVKGTNINNCSKVKGVTLEHKPEVPLLLNNAEILRCDGNNDGVETFNLTEANTQLTAQAGIVFTYFRTLNDLQSNSNAILNPTTYQNMVPNPSLVYVRLSAPATNCDSWGTITLNPFYQEYVFPASIIICDNNANGNELVNLESTVYDILSAYPSNSLGLEFYTSLANANAGTNSIPNPTAYVFTNFSTPIFVRITHLTTGCRIIKQLNYIVPAPIVLNPTVVNLCDYDRNNTETIQLENYYNQLNINHNNYNIKAYLTQLEAENGGNTGLISSVNYQQNVSSQLYWIRFENAQGCYSVSSITINIVSFPNPNVNPPVIELCDTNNTGNLQESFDLTLNENYIRNNNSTYAITYHTSLTNAQNALNPIATPTSFNSGTGSIWIRVVTTPVSLLTSCSVVIEQQLKVVPMPVPNINPPLLRLCDSNNAGNMTEVFNLTQNENYIRNGNSTYIITYHNTNTDAQIGSNAITNPSTFSGTTGSVWIRVTTNTSTALTHCAVLIEQQLEVVPYPIVNNNPPAIFKCDDNTPGDGREFFNLEQFRNYITNNNTQYVLSYHTSLSDAQNNLNPILNPTNYESTETSIWIRINAAPLSTLISCSAIIEQKLRINLLPQIGTISNYYSCINPNSTEATFILNTKNNEVLSGQSSSLFTVNYHLTEQEAKSGTNAIFSIYHSNTRTIWASLKNNSTGCINTSPLNLIAEPLTVAYQPAVNSTVLCDTDGNNNGLTVFNLTAYNSTILGPNQSASNYSVLYYASQSDLNNNHPITDPSQFENTSNPQTIYVKVVNESSVNKCQTIINFSIKVNTIPEPTPEDGTICFDQTTGNILQSYTIDSHLSNANHTFEWFYETDPNPIPNQTSSTLEVTQIGNYSVVATNTETNCTSELVMVTVIRSEPAIATARVEYSFNDVVNIVVTTTGNGNYNYQLDQFAVQESPVFENVSAGIHTIRILDLNGCDDAFLEVVVLKYPKFFTPNGDSRNDLWHIKGIVGQPYSKIYIFDRFGKLLKELYPNGDGWDGNYNGNPMPADDYWFTVDYTENGQKKEFKAHFAMKR